MTIEGAACTAPLIFAVIDPATQEPCGYAPECTSAQLDEAVATAARAQQAWALDETARRATLAQSADRLEAAADELGRLICAEQGRPLSNAVGEVRACALWLRYHAELALPERRLTEAAQARVVVGYRPHGVVAAITPWNFPLLLATWKLAPALLTGNAVVLKPSPFTPLATLRMGELLRDVIPPGVLNVVSGGDALGAQLVAHPEVRKISFTGSVAAGQAVARIAADGFKRVTLELGGNDAAIVLDDADPASIADALFWSAFDNTGQVCAAVKRVYVARAVAPELTDALVAIAERVRVGPGREEGVDLGPLTTRPQYDRVEHLVADAVASGARAVTGGHALEGPGNFFEPTLLIGAAPESAIVAEEQFGPVLPLLVYDDVEGALAAANATRFGLCGSVWGKDVERAARVAERLVCGTAYVNSHGAVAPYQPFGGVRYSGIGVENGPWGAEAYGDFRVTALPPEAEG